MKPGWFILLTVIYMHASGQQKTFPDSWTGNWTGELQWFKTGVPEPQKVNMELRIQPADSNKYTWHLIYGSPAKDSRPYYLVPKDTAGIHWVVDENDGIILDQYWVGNKLCGVFTVMNSTIINKYWIEDDTMVIEFITIGAKPAATTGKGSGDIPFVDSYKVNGYQLARLKRN
jgi:hypothetical protein